MGTSNSLPNEIKLSGGNHVFNVKDIIEYVSDLGVPNSLVLYARHFDGKNASNPPMQEDFKFVEQALLERPCLTAP